MPRPKRPFGLWPSPISPRHLAEERRLDGVRWDSDGRTLVWLEGRSGQGVLVAQASGGDAPRDISLGTSVRAEVGYGGGDFNVHGGVVYYAAHRDGRLFRQPLGGGPARPMTPAFGKAAAPAVSPDGRWVVYVHSDDAGVDRLAIVDSAGTTWPQILAEGRDFYMQPCWSPDGRQLAWVSWDHPHMPWDASEVYVGRVCYDPTGLPRLADVRRVAGGSGVAVFQPEFAADGGSLFCVSDETGWWRIRRSGFDGGKPQWLTPEGEECAVPAWVQGMRTYAITPDGRRLVAAANRDGFQRVVEVELASGRSRSHDALAEYGDLSHLAASADSHSVAMVASGPRTPPRVIVYDLESSMARVVARASGEAFEQAELAGCESICWPGPEGEPVYGLYYAPPQGVGEMAAAPLVTIVHGGPTSQVRGGWRADAQFLATRGYGVLYVNYRGSSGYGRRYMQALRGNWGVCDVEDSLGGKRHLVELGKADPGRTAIMGGSAGGFTVLQTMATHPEEFTAGISLYGVADQFHLAADTHKFEAHYLDSLLGPLPDAAAVYRERSPLRLADRIRRPMAIFQGEIDRVVPRNQSDSIVAGLQRRGTPCVYHVYEGEGHGWRKRESIEHFYGAIDAFLRQHVIFA